MKKVKPDYYDEFCNLMQSPDYTIEEALKMIFFMMLSWDEKEQNDEAIKPQDISNAFKPDFLEQLKAAVNDVKHDASDCFMEQNELCLDIAENYRIYMPIWDWGYMSLILSLVKEDS